MKITIDNTDHISPDSWNDCNLEQCLYAYAMLMTDLSQNFEPFELLPVKRIMIAARLIDYPVEKMNDWENSQILALTTAVTGFLFDKVESEEGKPDQYTISLTLTKNPYPYFQFRSKKKKHRKLISPTDVLDNLTIYELGTTFTIFENYLSTQDEAMVNKLIAILYRPEKPKTKYNKDRNYEGDRRQPYLNFEATVPAREQKIKKLPQAVKAIILFWFASCRQTIIEQYENIFVQETSTTGEQVGNDYGWGGILMGLADGLVHLDAVSTQNYKNAFARLSYLEDERKKIDMKRLANK